MSFSAILLCYRWPVTSKFMRIKLEFDENIKALKSGMVTLEQAVDQLMSCEALVELLHVVLLAGNIINGVSYLLV